jgi:transporter family-2 protein
MQTIIVVIIIGILGGIAVGFQGPLTSLMSQHLGILESVFIVHVGGAIVAGAPLLFLGGGHLADWRSVPWYALGAGALGLIILAAISYTIPRLGIAPTITLIVMGQLLIGTVSDHFGFLGANIRPMDAPRLLGLVILLVGTWLVVR